MKSCELSRIYGFSRPAAARKIKALFVAIQLGVPMHRPSPGEGNDSPVLGGANASFTTTVSFVDWYKSQQKTDNRSVPALA
jgi:hypothetical protein